MPVNRASIAGSPYLGVYLRVSERGVVAPPSLPDALGHEIERLFGAPVIRTTVLDSELVGSLLALNSSGAIVAEEPGARERHHLASMGPLTVVPTLQNALGNNVLANDLGALVHPGLSESAAARIGEALRVRVARVPSLGWARSEWPRWRRTRASWSIPALPKPRRACCATPFKCRSTVPRRISVFRSSALA